MPWEPPLCFGPEFDVDQKLSHETFLLWHSTSLFITMYIINKLSIDSSIVIIILFPVFVGQPSLAMHLKLELWKLLCFKQSSKAFTSETACPKVNCAARQKHGSNNNNVFLPCSVIYETICLEIRNTMLSYIFGGRQLVFCR